ncbi:MAG: hypothetical protein ACOC56_06260 [Atribacterota bacterium]
MSEVNKENVKKALDDFEDERYVQSKDTLKKEFRKKFNDYLKKELDTEADPVDGVEPEETEEDDSTSEDE